MKLLYPAVFTPYEDGTGGYVVEFPDLPGCVTGGDSLEEAIEMAIDAASGWVLTELEEGNEIPRASDYKSIQTEEIVSMILLDMDSYTEKYGQKAAIKSIYV